MDTGTVASTTKLGSLVLVSNVVDNTPKCIYPRSSKIWSIPARKLKLLRNANILSLKITVETLHNDNIHLGTVSH